MKYFISSIAGVFLLLLSTSLNGQYLTVGNHDYIGFGDYPDNPYILEAENNHYYLLTGSNLDVPAHPMLVSNAYSDFYTKIIMKYGPDGKPVWVNNIFGYSNIYLSNALMQNDNLVVFGSGSGNVEIEGRLISIDNGSRIEFMAKYDKDGKYLNHASVWKPIPSTYPSSSICMSPFDGSFFVYGQTYHDSLILDNSAVIGSEWGGGDFIYVIKYSKDLEYLWSFTTGFKKDSANGYGYFNKIIGIPDAQGNLLLTGAYSSQFDQPIFGDEVLSYFPDSDGMFAYKLSGDGKALWAKQGFMEGYSYDGTGIYEGFGMSNGDIILAATTSTGRFQLSNVDIVFEDAFGRENFLVMRMDPNGNAIWSSPIQSMGYPHGEEKSEVSNESDLKKDKDSKSNVMNSQINWDALMLNEDKVCILGLTANDSMTIDGEKLPNVYGEAAFVVSLSADDGSEDWGHTVSSNYIYLSGFDADGFGNIVFSGNSDQTVNVKGMGDKSYLAPSGIIQFMHGVDFNGNPIWFNEAYHQEVSYYLTITDIEVLKNGTTVAPFYSSQAYPVNIGGQSFIYDYQYINYLFMMEEPNLFSGWIRDSEQSAVYPATVKAFYQAASGEFPVMDSTAVGDDGSFSFSNLIPGKYTFRVEVDPADYSDAVPTYFGNRIQWQEAMFITIEATDTLTNQYIMITEIPALGPDDGSGQVLGNVSYSGDGKKAVGRPVKKASVVLVGKATKKSTQQEITAIIQTDDDGNYLFDYVPDGTYSMSVDIPGLNMVRTYENVVILGNQIVSGLDFIVDEETGIDIIWGVGINQNRIQPINLYPNPGSGGIYIDNVGNNELYVTIYSVDARMLMTSRMNSGSGNYLDISHLDAGIYFIKMESDEGMSIVKYILE